MHHSTLSDDELLQRFRRTGNNTWLGHLLQRYTLLLLGVAMKYLKDKNAAHDAVQHIFLKSLTHLPAGEIGNFKGWLYVMLRNHCLQMLRDTHHHAAEEALQYVPAAPDQKQEHEQLEATIGQMQAALSQLNAAQRTCVQAFYLDRRSYHDIMAVTGYSFAEVKSHIQNGKRNLRILLTKNARHQ